MYFLPSFGSYFKRLDKKQVKFHVAFSPPILFNALIFNFFLRKENSFLRQTLL